MSNTQMICGTIIIVTFITMCSWGIWLTHQSEVQKFRAATEAGLVQKRDGVTIIWTLP